MLADGYYDGKIVATGFSGGDEGKAEAIVIESEITETGDRFRSYLYCSERAWPYTEEKLAKLGWDATAHGFRFEELNGDDSPLIGAPCTVRLKSEEYDGKMRQKADVFAPGGGGVKRLESGEAASFADRLRRRILGGGGGLSEAPRANGAAAAQDDIPF